MAAWGTSTSRGIATRKRVGDSLLCASTISGTPRTRWTRWTARCWTGGSCACRWPGTEDPPTPTTAEGGEEDPPGDTAVTDAGAEAVPPARDTDGAADPAAGAAPVPEADPATANPDPGPTRDPSPTLRGPRRPRPSPSPRLVPGLDPGPGPSPSPGPEVAPPPPKEDPGQDLKASPKRQQKMEANPLKAQFDGDR